MSEDISQAEKIYAEYRKVLLDRQQSNSERYDSALLSLSTGALGISLAFIKDIVPIESLTLTWVLVASWLLFATSIILTVTSYITSQKGIDAQLQYAEEYYLNRKEEYLHKSNPYSIWTERFNLSSGVCFIAALAATILFVSVNLSEAKEMSEKKSDSTPTFDGAVVPRMQSVGSNERIEKGAPIPSMQPAPPPPQSPPPPPSDGKK